MTAQDTLGRRQLWSLPLALTGTKVAPLTTSTTPDYVHVRDFGAAGNGIGDDTAALQAALNAAPSGSTVICQPGAKYLVLGTLTMQTNGVTLDLNGSTIIDASVAGAGPTEVLFLKGASPTNRLTGVRVTNGTILAPTAGGGLAFLVLVQVLFTQACRFDHVTINGINAQTGINLVNCNQMVIEDCYFNGTGINGDSCQECIIQRNVLDGPFEGIGMTGYAAGTVDAGGFAAQPLLGNRYLYNVIRNYSRVGIELFSTNALTVTAQEIVGNHIETFNVVEGGTVGQATLGSGQAISSISTGTLIAENVIEDAGPNWAIESDVEATRVIANRVVWTRTGAPGTAIIANSSAQTEVMSTIVANQTVNGLAGISVVGAAPYFAAAVAINGNIVQDCQSGIDVSYGGNPGEGTTVIGNLVRYTAAAGASRVGINVGQNAHAQGNRVDFLPEVGETEDVALGMFNGASGMLTGNVVDAGGSSIPSSAQGGNANDWVITANRFQNGASLNVSQSNQFVTTLVENLGPVTGPTPTVANAGSPPAGSPTPSVSGSDFGGTVSFTSSSAPTAGGQVVLTFGRPRHDAPLVELQAADPHTAKLGLYVAAVSPTGFTIALNQAPPAGVAMTVLFTISEPAVQ